MDIFTFIAEVIGVTASGALAPGPLFFKNIAEGTKSGARSGLAFAVGHTVVEFSLVIVLALGLLTVVDQPLVRLVVGIVGGTALLIFGVMQIREASISKPHEESKQVAGLKSNLLLGTIFTGLNPYFVLWWLSAGLRLIWDSLTLASLPGVVIMYVAHVWMDYAWMIGTAYLAKRGTKLMGRQGFRIGMIIFGVVLIGFGLYFVVTAFS